MLAHPIGTYNDIDATDLVAERRRSRLPNRLAETVVVETIELIREAAGQLDLLPAVAETVAQRTEKLAR